MHKVSRYFGIKLVSETPFETRSEAAQRFIEDALRIVRESNMPDRAKDFSTRDIKQSAKRILVSLEPASFCCGSNSIDLD